MKRGRPALAQGRLVRSSVSARALFIAALLLAGSAAALGSSYEEVTVKTGAELVAAIAKQTRPTRLLLASDVVALRSAQFSMYPLPLAVRWNLTIAGAPDRWPILDMGFVQGKVRLAKDVWFTFEDLLMVNYTDGTNAGSGIQMFAPMAAGEEAVQAQVRGGSLEPYCFPNAVTEAAIAVARRPASMPGVNRYLPLDGPPPALNAGSSSSSSSSGGGCSNATDAPIRNRCYPQVGQYVDLVGLAYMADNLTSFAPTGMLMYAHDLISLCKQVLTADCMSKYGEFGCIILNFRSAYMPSVAAFLAAADDGSSGSSSEAGGGSSSSSSSGGGSGSGSGSGGPSSALGSGAQPRAPDPSSQGGTGGGGGGMSGGQIAAVVCGTVGGVALAVLIAVLFVTAAARRRRAAAASKGARAADASSSSACGACGKATPEASTPRTAGEGASALTLVVLDSEADDDAAAFCKQQHQQPQPLPHSSDDSSIGNDGAPVPVPAGSCSGRKAAAAAAAVMSGLSDAGTLATSHDGMAMLSPGGDGSSAGVAVVDVGRDGAAAATAVAAAVSAAGKAGGSSHAAGGPYPPGCATYAGTVMGTHSSINTCDLITEQTPAQPHIHFLISGSSGRHVAISSAAGSRVAAKHLATGASLPGADALQGSSNAAGAVGAQVPSGLLGRGGQEPQQLQLQSAAPPPAVARMVALATAAAASAAAAAAVAGGGGGDNGGAGSGGDSSPAPGEDAVSDAAAGADMGVMIAPNGLLGRGSFGRVYRGRYQGTEVAVKLFAELVTADEGGTSTRARQEAGNREAIESLQQEVEVLSRCQHPNIVTLLAVCVTPPRLCMVMELMECNLHRLIHRRPPGQPRLLPLHTVVDIALDVANALGYLHPTITHRDLKPANVLINGVGSARPVAKLTDFGVARLCTTLKATNHPEAGTPPYLAPECFDVQNWVVTHQADMYSFGVLLWEMLSGEEPWKGEPMARLAYRLVHCGNTLPLETIIERRCQPPPSGAAVPEPALPGKLLKLVAQCFERDARRRPAAAEAVKALLLVREALGQQLQPHPAHEPAVAIAPAAAVAPAPAVAPGIAIAADVASEEMVAAAPLGSAASAYITATAGVTASAYVTAAAAATSAAPESDN